MNHPDHHHHAARLVALQGTGAGAWLAAIPAMPSLRMSSPDTGMTVRLRLGLPLPILPSGTKCTCGALLDKGADHLFVCPVGGNQTTRHDGSVRAWALVLREAGGSVTPEVPLGTLNPCLAEAARRAHEQEGREEGSHSRGAAAKVMDLVKVAPENEWYDVTIFHPGAARAKRCARAADTTTISASRAKHVKYDEAAKASGVRFTPLTATTWGGWGPEAVATIRGISRRLKERAEALNEHPPAPGLFAARAWALLGVNLCRGNAALVRNKAIAAVDLPHKGHSRSLPHGDDVRISVVGEGGGR